MFRTILSTLIPHAYGLLALLIFSNVAHTAPQNQAVILQYHHVSTTTPASTSVSFEQFKRHLDLIDSLGFQVLSLPEILTHIHQGIPFSQKTVGISFDDGYLSIYQNAFPELQKRHLPFTIFVSPQAIDSQHGNSLNWKQLKEMQNNGATIANHSWNHDHLLSRRPHEQTHEWSVRMTNNIKRAQLRLNNELGIKNTLFAYPYGEFNHDLKKIMQGEGYLAFSQQSGPVSNYSDKQALPRFPASGRYANLATLSVKLNSLAFKIMSEEPRSDVILFGQPSPTLVLKIDKQDVNHRQLQCFYFGEAIDTQVIKTGDMLTIRATSASSLKAGRSRYNCTAPSLSLNRYYWYSMPFIVLNEIEQDI